MAEAKRDNNHVPTLIAVSNVDGETPVVLWADPTTHRLLVSSDGGLSGPGSSTDNAIIRWDGTSGDTLQNSGVIIDDSDNVTGLGTLNTHTIPSGTSTFAILTNTLGDFGATSSAQLAGVISDETGSGALVFANTPTLVTPEIGVATGTSIDLGGTTLMASRSITVDTGGAFNIALASAAGDDFTVDTTKFVVEGDSGKVGIGITSPDGTLHVHTASAGTIAADTNSDEAVFENSSAGGISILTPAASNSQYVLGSPSQNLGALFRWNHTADQGDLAVNKVGASLILRADGFIQNLTLSGASGSELGTFEGRVLVDNALIGDATTPSVAFGDGDSGFYENADDELSLSLAGSERYRFGTGSIIALTGDSFALINEAATATNPTLCPARGDTDTGIGWTSANILSIVTGGVQAVQVNTVASGVNFLDITPGATGNAVDVAASGTDTNIDLTLTPKGTGIVKGELKRFMVRLLASDTAMAVDTSVGGDYRISNRAITVKAVGAYVDTAGTTGTATIDIHEAGTTIMTTNKITLDTGEKSSETAATAPAVTDTAIAADAIITFDVDGIHTTPANGLTVWIDYVYA